MSDYDYLNARVRGMSRHLLTREFFDQTLAADGTDALVDVLLNSDYGSDLREALTVHTGLAAAESALRRNLFRTFRKIRLLAADEPRRLLNVQFARWDAQNVRTIIRGKVRGAEDGDIVDALLPAGYLDEAQLRELAAQPDVLAVADSLTAWDYAFAFRLRELIRQSGDPLDLLKFEAELDRLYFDWALSELEGKDENQEVVRDLVRQQIDLASVLTALRTVHAREQEREPDAVEPFSGGRIRSDVIDRMARCGKLEEALEILETTYFAPGIEKGILFFGERRRLGVMERFLEIVVIEGGCKLFRLDPLCVAVPLGFMWRKCNEFVNLRILLRGKAYGVPMNTIREELLLV